MELMETLHHWSQAEELFKGILLKHQDDSVSQVYLARSQQLQMYTPEAGWDGIYDLQK